MAKLLYITVVLTSWIKLSLLTDVLVILPDNPVNTSCPSQPCATLSQYLLDNNGTLPVLSNVEYHLLPGEHHVPLYHGFFSLYNFTFVGITGQYSPPVVLISCLKSFLKIFDSQYVIIRNIIFKPCQTIQSYQQHNGVKTNLFLDTCFSCIIENVTFFEYGLMGQNLLGRSFLSNMFIDLTITMTGTYLNYHGIALYYSSLQSSGNLENYSIACTLNAVSICGYGSKHLPHKSYIRNYLRSIAIKIYQTNYHVTIAINNCHFHNIDQGLMNIVSFNSATNNTVLIENCIFEYIESMISLVPVIEIQVSSFSTILSISNCEFHHIAWFQSTLEIMINPLISSKHNDAKVFIKACSFFDNSNPLLLIKGDETDLLQLGPIEVKLTDCRGGVFFHTIQISSMKVLIQGPVTIDNNRSPDSLLIFEKCNITFSDKVMFKTNVCSSLITLKSETFFVKLIQNATIAFSDNYISNEIIDIDNDQYHNPYPYCIFQFISSQNIYTNTTPSPTNYRIIFDRNFINAKEKEKCKVSFYHYTSHCQWINSSVFHGYDPTIINEQIVQHESDQMNERKTICFCSNNVTDCSLDVLGQVYPGQTLQVELCVPCSGEDATLHVETHHRSLPTSACKIAHQNQLINFLTPHTSILNFTIVSNATETCELFLTVSPFLYRIYEVFYVRLQPCPIGFVLQNGICDCDPVLISNKFIHIETCEIDQLTIKRPPNSWIVPLTSDNSTYSLCSNCPMDYCLPHSSDLNLQYPDTQCQFNRTDTLCSQCQHSLSMVFGSSRCIPCTNIHALITIAILFAGMSLVVILYLLNLTVTNGTITGVIFYANIISINDSIFLVNDNIFAPLRVFISFVNLDLGIETCFYNGMDSYAKMLIQLFFPLYLIIISIFIIIASRYSMRMSQWTSTRSLPVLATLFLLSYTSVVRTVLTVLFSYSTITRLPSGHQQIVWSIDASVPLLRIRFVLLFMFVFHCF